MMNAAMMNVKEKQEAAPAFLFIPHFAFRISI